MKFLWVLLTILLAAHASASTIELDAPPHPQVDDWIYVKYRLDPKPAKVPEVVTRNLDEVKVTLGLAGVLSVSGFIRSAATVEVPKFTYVDAEGLEHSGAAFRLPVKIGPPDTRNVQRLLDHYRSFRRPAALVIPVVDSAAVALGDSALVEWFVVGDLMDGSSLSNKLLVPTHELNRPMTGSIEKRLVLDNAKEIYEIPTNEERRSLKLGEEIFTGVRVAAIRVVPSRVGKLEIPSLSFTAITRSYIPGSPPTSILFRRISPPATVEAVDSPDDTNVARGRFEISCGAENQRNLHWPHVWIEVTGTGSLLDVEPPRLVERPVPLIRVPGGAPIVSADGRIQRRWIYRARAIRDLSLPEIQFDYYDTSREEIRSLSCVSINLAAPPAEEPTDRKLFRISEAVLGLMSLLCLLFVRSSIK